MSDTIAGRFELLEPIAKGGSGAVWRARDLKLGRDCAAKVLRQRDSADLLRFVREQSVKLDHPHVVAPYGWAAEDEYVAIGMRLVSGGTLEAALGDNGAVSEAVAEEILYQLLQALQFVHARGWIHRDVKPGNVLMEPTGSGRPWVRLADFGIAVRADDARLTHTGTVVGTPGYLPHEAYGPMEPSASTDLYAAGVTAVRLVDPHVDLSNPLEPAAVAGLFPESPQLRAHVAGLLSTDPQRRIAAAKTALRDLGEGAPRRCDSESLTAEGEPFEIFDVLSPTTERELSAVPDAAVLPPSDDAPTARIQWHAVRGQGEQVQQPHPAPPFSADPLNPFGAEDETEPLPRHGAVTTVARDRAFPDTDPAQRVTRTEPARTKRSRVPWVFLALVLAAVALTAGYFWVGPVMNSWLNGPPAPEPEVTQPREDTATPSAPQEPSMDVTPVCTEQEDGTLSCVLTP
ncbi:protein kinase [Kocuria sp. cx-455]|uniref:serine/threonine-protein kinase n=1 Tax=Kocuria sp. cx-455 TaxID=2771377 RepID=UPI0016853CE7|nr:serine/threonine-protein kinase [Kocuria sp. cx-455]MBD2765545.1 protein kinase [Kocuria sp. cx-455]